MIVNNFDTLINFYKNNYPFNKFMDNDACDTMYLTISVIKRNKDLPTDMKNKLSDEDLKYKTYIIKSIQDIEKYRDDIIMLCDGIHARAYITYNVRYNRDIWPAMLNTISTRITMQYDCPNSAYKHIPNIIDNVMRNTPVELGQYCMLDIDGAEYTNNDIKAITDIICKYKGNVYCTYKSISGYHVIYDTNGHSETNKKISKHLESLKLLTKNEYNTISFKSPGCRALLYANI